MEKTDNRDFIEDPLKDLFSEFNPPLSPAGDFIRSLEARLDAVEEVKARAEVARRQTRRSMAVSALAGVLVGMLLTLAYPTISSALASVLSASPESTSAATFLAWLLVSAASVGASVLTLDLTRPIRR